MLRVAFGGFDWRLLFIPDKPVLEILLRGSVVYLAAFALLRILKREAGTLSVTDLIVVVFLADAAQNAMGDSYTSIPSGVLLMATIVFWAYLFDRLAFFHPWIARLLEPPPLPLVKDGRMVTNNMRKEFISEDELMSQLRLQGIEDVAEVKRAFIEPDGRISVIQHQERRHSPLDRIDG